MRKSSASTGRNSGSSAPGLHRRRVEAAGSAPPHCGGELEVFSGHVTVGARTAVAFKGMRLAIEKAEQPAKYRRARLAATLAV